MELNELRKIAEAATPGPWHWSGNSDNRQLYLATWLKGAGRCQVMDFERWGMQGAVPRFLDDDSLMMETAKDLMVYEVARNQNLPDDTPRNHPKVYRADVVDVRHPNARFMAAANPETVLALLTRLEQTEEDRVKMRNRLDAMRRQRDGYRNQLRKTEQQVQRVRELHERIPVVVNGRWEIDHCKFCYEQDYSSDYAVWPCPTIRALDGDGRG